MIEEIKKRLQEITRPVIGGYRRPETWEEQYQQYEDDKMFSHGARIGYGNGRYDLAQEILELLKGV